MLQHFCNLIDINSDIPANCFSARWRFIKLQKFFYIKEFKKAYKFLDKIKKTPENLNTCRSFPKEVITLILKAIRTRWILKKIIFIWRQKILQKNIKIVNNLSLCLDPMETIDKNNIVSIYNNNTNTSYVFDYGNLIHTFRMRLENATYGIAKPKNLINPYTNEALTLPQRITIFERFKEILFKKKQRLPTILLLYSKTYNVNKLKKNHTKYIDLLACSNYVKDMSVEGFNLILDNYIEDYFADKICSECVKKDLKNYRDIFQPIIINFVSYSNKIISVCKFIKMTNKIIINYNILAIESTEHKVRHRKIIKAHRRLSIPRNQQILFSANRRSHLSNNRDSNISNSNDDLTRIRQRIERLRETAMNQNSMNIELSSGNTLNSAIEITESQTPEIDSDESYADGLILFNVDESYYENNINSNE